MFFISRPTNILGDTIKEEKIILSLSSHSRLPLREPTDLQRVKAAVGRCLAVFVIHRDGEKTWRGDRICNSMTKIFMLQKDIHVVNSTEKSCFWSDLSSSHVIETFFSFPHSI
jgi:hypothetical protein